MLLRVMGDKKKSKRQSDLTSASRVLQILLANGKSVLSDPFLRWRLWRFWDQVVGPVFAKDCEPVGFQRGRLFIWVKSSARLQEFRFFEDDFRVKINAYLGTEWVKSVRFTLDRKGVPQDTASQQNLKNFIDSQNE